MKPGRTFGIVDIFTMLLLGADPGYFLGGGAPLMNDVTDR